MASSLVEKIHLHFLQCGICHENFQNPHALPCLHTFCEECLERWYKTNKTEHPKILICPTCKKSAEIPSEGIKGFPADFKMNSLQETVNMEKLNISEDFSERVCTRCNKPDKSAEVHCIECGYDLCSACLDLHKSWKGMQNHQVLSKEDMSSGKLSLSDNVQDKYCAEHDGEQMRFYCETCDKPVCRDCIALKQCCRDHDVIPIKQAARKTDGNRKQQKERITEKCQEATEKAENLLVKTKTLKEEIEELIPTPKIIPDECSERVEGQEDLLCSSQQKTDVAKEDAVLKSEPVKPKPVQCWECDGYGHIQSQCPERICYNCREKGHMSWECSGRSMPYDSDVCYGECYDCGEYGHFARDCRRYEQGY